MNILIAILGALPTLISLAEKLFGSGTGVAKKQAVTDMAGTLVSGLQQLSTGGQKKTMDTLAPLLSPIIDVLAGTLFPPAKSNPSGISDVSAGV